MAARVTQAEKELMWKLYQKYGSITAVCKIVKRCRGTVSRYVGEYEAAVSIATKILNVENHNI